MRKVCKNCAKYLPLESFDKVSIMKWHDTCRECDTEQLLIKAVDLLEQYHACYKIANKIDYETTGDIFLNRPEIKKILDNLGIIRDNEYGDNNGK